MSANNNNNNNNNMANENLASTTATTNTTYPMLDPTDFQDLSARGLAQVVDANYIRLHRSLQHNGQPPVGSGSWGPSPYPPAQSNPPSDDNTPPQPDPFITLPRYMGTPHWYMHLGFTPCTAARLSRRFHSKPYDVSPPTYGIASSHVQRFKPTLDLNDGTSPQNRDHLFRLSLLIGFSEEVRRYLCDFPSTSAPTPNTGGEGGMYDDGDTVLDWLLEWIYTRDHFLQHVHMYSELRGEWLVRQAHARQAEAERERRARNSKRRNDLMRRNMHEAQERRQRAKASLLLGQRGTRATSPEDREDSGSESDYSQ